MWLWKRRERFSLDELKYLTEQLQRTSYVSDFNKESIIETLRSIAELMIWGDQHDSSFFEYFMEKQVMVLFLHILKLSTSTAAVAVQLLQSISIMIQNIRSEHAIYYIFSNGYLNHFVTYPFDFRHEELLAYYISFLRTISTKLDQTTISFFINTENDEVVAFPLYTEAIRFFRHEESMVRIAVRTITLNVYHVNDKSVRKFVSSQKVVGYIADLVKFLREKSSALDDLFADAGRSMSIFPRTHEADQSIARLEGDVADTEEILDYCNDIIRAGIPDLSRVMTENLLHLFVVPVLCSLASDSALSALYMLARVLHIIRHKPLANGIAAALLCESSLREGHAGNDISSSPQKEVTGSDARSVFNSKDAPLGSVENGVPTLCPRKIILSYIVSNNDKLALASVSLLLALLHNEALDDSLLDLLGLLPRLKQHRRRLLQALMGNKSDEERLFSSSPDRAEDIGEDGDGVDICDYSTLMAESEQTIDGKTLRGGTIRNDIKKKACCNFLCNSSMQREEVLEKLLELLCRRPPPCVEALWQTGALLSQIFPDKEDDRLHNSRLEMIRNAYSQAKEDLLKELDDCWCDVIPSVISDEWQNCQRALESSHLQKDTSFLLTPICQSIPFEDDFSSSTVAARMRTAAKVVVAIYQVQHLLLKGSIMAFPPLDWSSSTRKDGDGVKPPIVKVGIQLDLTPDIAIPCRVAFERGKERAVYLIAMARGVTGWLLLAEDVPSKPGWGMIRVMAPLSGSLPEIDEEHPRWLHLRIRPPHLPSSDTTQGSKSTRMRRIDGRWTLAFADIESCRKAKVAVMKEILDQKNAVKQMLQPLFGSIDSASSV